MYARDYREIARNNLSNNWGLSIGVAAIACLLGGTLCGSEFLPDLEIKIENQNISSIYALFLFFASGAGITLSLVSVLGLAQFILGGTIQLGHARYLLNQYDHRNPQFGDLFSQFENFGTGFCQSFLRSLYVFLWSLLLIIPGIVAGYSYAMTPYILAEHPNMTASEAISASKIMMDGHKWELFCLHFSFFGWSLLCTLTLNIGYIFLNPYSSAAEAAFYRNLTKQRIFPN